MYGNSLQGYISGLAFQQHQLDGYHPLSQLTSSSYATSASNNFYSTPLPESPSPFTPGENLHSTSTRLPPPPDSVDVSEDAYPYTFTHETPYYTADRDAHLSRSIPSSNAQVHITHTPTANYVDLNENSDSPRSQSISFANHTPTQTKWNEHTQTHNHNNRNSIELPHQTSHHHQHSLQQTPYPQQTPSPTQQYEYLNQQQNNSLHFLPSHHETTPHSQASTPPGTSYNLVLHSVTPSASASASMTTPLPASASSHTRASPAIPSKILTAEVTVAELVPCNNCRRRKRTCNGAKPSCAFCKSSNSTCIYPNQPGVKRGPTAGVVSQLRQQVASLHSKLNLLKEKSVRQMELSSILEIKSQKAIYAFLKHCTSTKDQSYIQAFFARLNSQLFPFLDRTEFIIQHSRLIADMKGVTTGNTKTEPTPSEEEEDVSNISVNSLVDINSPLTWIFQYTCAITVGAHMNQDFQYSKYAASVARLIACALFDEPSYPAIRALLLFSYYLIGINQQKTAASYLAVVKRMLFLVPMFHASSVTKVQSTTPGNSEAPLENVKLSDNEHQRLHEQLRLMFQFLDDMLASKSWWKYGLDYNPTHTGNNSAQTSDGTATSLASPTLLAADDAFNQRSTRDGSSTFESSPTLGLVSTVTGTATGAENLAGWPGLTNTDSEEEFELAEYDVQGIRGGNLGLFEFKVEDSFFDIMNPREALPTQTHQPTPEGQRILLRGNVDPLATPAPVTDDVPVTSTATATPTTSTGAAPVIPGGPTVLVEEQLTQAQATQQVTPGEATDITPGQNTTSTPTPGATSSTPGSNNGADLQLNLIRVLCTISSIRGRFYKCRENAALLNDLHRCLGVLNEAERRLQNHQAQWSVSPVLMSIRATVMCMKAIVLRILITYHTSLEEHEEGLMYSQMVHAAKTASLLSAHVDLTFCPFLGIFHHLISQIHLSSLTQSNNDLTSHLRYLLPDLQFQEKLAQRWSFCIPIFHNVQARVWSKLSAINPPHLMPVVMDSNLLHVLTVSMNSYKNHGNNSTTTPGFLLQNTVTKLNQISFFNQAKQCIAANDNTAANVSTQPTAPASTAQSFVQVKSEKVETVNPASHAASDASRARSKRSSDQYVGNDEHSQNMKKQRVSTSEVIYTPQVKLETKNSASTPYEPSYPTPTPTPNPSHHHHHHYHQKVQIQPSNSSYNVVTAGSSFSTTTPLGGHDVSHHEYAPSSTSSTSTGHNPFYQAIREGSTASAVVAASLGVLPAGATHNAVVTESPNFINYSSYLSEF